MRQYIKIEAKRLFHTLPGFILSLCATILLVMSTIFLAKTVLPEALEVKPFRIGLCVEGKDLISNYVNQYLQQMESTEKIIAFQEMEQQEITAALEAGELTAGIVIPEKTAQSIMDGTNIPVQVWMGKSAGQTERYLQQRLLTLLTECGAVLIDVPQAETLLLYEMQAENPQELGMTLDLFHFGLVLERESWFQKESMNAFGGADAKAYYLAAALTLLLLFWGLGSGSFFREKEGNLPLLLERKGISLIFQQGVKQSFYSLLYLSGVLLIFLLQSIGAAFGIRESAAMLLCAVMLALQCGFFFELAPTVASGIVLNCVWGLTGFFGAGGILPIVFLPKAFVSVCGRLPAGICMELLLQAVGGKRGISGKTAGLCLLWCLLFGVGGQIIFCGKQWSKKRT